tara:strand:+ start:69 stop:509 length:441 start_codon:yes stop_codon:yes gene_type:complete
MKFVDNIMKNKKLLSNNPLLYGTAIISFLNILGFIQIGKMNIVLLYIIIAIILSVYTKNMVVVLGAPLLIVNLVSYMGYNIEGMEERKEEEEEGEEEDDLDVNLKELNEKMGELSDLATGIDNEEEEGDEEYEDEDEDEETMEEEE